MTDETRRRWRTRRLMAWVGFWWVILSVPTTALLYKLKFIDTAFITAMSGVVIGVLTAIGAIISTYIGASAYDDVNNPPPGGEGP